MVDFFNRKHPLVRLLDNYMYIMSFFAHLMAISPFLKLQTPGKLSTSPEPDNDAK